MSTRWIDREKKLRLIGDRPNGIDTVYVDNAADAHLATADRLPPGAADAATQSI